ncbi:hypothetical protein [Pseudochelatococcus sp. G4_1912]|uniref:hypothetical protein n=1 Tax=Pseudochelatococcus sp. G4_1912 TaxID=3114288 RepID=UPI0039C67054
MPLDGANPSGFVVFREALVTFTSTVSTRIKTSALLTGAMLAALLTASCNTSQNAPVKAEAHDGSVYAAPLNTAALSQQPCGAPIIAYRNLIDRDVRTGFLSQTVYDRIAPQIASAAATCMAGNNSAAMSSLNNTKRSFGYPT